MTRDDGRPIITVYGFPDCLYRTFLCTNFVTGERSTRYVPVVFLAKSGNVYECSSATNGPTVLYETRAVHNVNFSVVGGVFMALFFFSFFAYLTDSNKTISVNETERRYNTRAR